MMSQPDPRFPPGYEHAAAQAVGQVQQDPGVDAGESLSQMQVDRPVPLPAEDQMDAVMAEFKAMTERLRKLESDAAATRQQYAAAVAALGPPEVAVYGKAIADKLVSFRNANPDLGTHFDAVIEKARPVATAAQAVLDGTGHVEDVTRDLQAVVEAVDRFITRTHPRTAAKPLDFSALASDLEYVMAAAEKLAALTP